MRIWSFFRAAWRRGGAGVRSRRAHRFSPAWDPMDDRLLLSADAASASMAAITASPSLDVLSVTSTSPSGYSPAEIRAAYGINAITFSNGTITGDGAGETIAIIDAYSDPNIASDLAAFDAEYGLAAPPSFTVANLGATTTDAGWALETALDVEWAHAIAPDANIVLVEASSDSLPALFGAVSYASTLSGVSVISMSWGTSEFSTETNYDRYFTTPSGHTSITYVAASGDDGASVRSDVPRGVAQRPGRRRHDADAVLERLVRLGVGLERQHGRVQPLRVGAVLPGRGAGIGRPRATASGPCPTSRSTPIRARATRCMTPSPTTANPAGSTWAAPVPPRRRGRGWSRSPTRGWPPSAAARSRRARC